MAGRVLVQGYKWHPSMHIHSPLCLPVCMVWVVGVQHTWLLLALLLVWANRRGCQT